MKLLKIKIKLIGHVFSRYHTCKYLLCLSVEVTGNLVPCIPLSNQKKIKLVPCILTPMQCIVGLGYSTGHCQSCGVNTEAPFLDLGTGFGRKCFGGRSYYNLTGIFWFLQAHKMSWLKEIKQEFPGPQLSSIKMSALLVASRMLSFIRIGTCV